MEFAGDESSVVRQKNAEIAALNEQINTQKLKLYELEEQLDILSFENLQLRNQLSEYKKHSSLPERKSAATDSVQSSYCVNYNYVDDNLYPNTLIHKYQNICNHSNVLSVKYLYDEIHGHDIIICGGVDKILRGVNSKTHNVLFESLLTAPILSIACHRYSIACSLMDGSIVLVNIESQLSNSIDNESFTIDPLVVSEHNKYTVDIKFSQNGSYVATASQDKSVCLYKCKSQIIEDDNWFSGGNISLKFISKFRYEQTPESIAFISSDIHAEKLFIAIRDSCNVIVVDCNTLVQTNFSLNENSWDTHKSFNALYLSVSPDQKTFSISTDNDLHLIYSTNDVKRLRTLAGHTSGAYGKPKVSWDYTGQYLLSNSEIDNSIYVYSLSTERVLETLGRSGSGHTGKVRDIDCHHSQHRFLSASFDHSVIEWGR